MAYIYPFRTTRALGGVSPTTLLSKINAHKRQLTSITTAVGPYTFGKGNIEARLTELSRTYQYLTTGVFDIINGTVSGTTEFPNFNSGNFQAWDRLSSTTSNGEIHVAYAGHLNPIQTTISEINVPIQGTGNYRLKVYVEGTTDFVFDSGILAAPTNRTVTTITSLLEQPTNEKRYFVVIEAFIDAGEYVNIGLPFTTHTTGDSAILTGSGSSTPGSGSGSGSSTPTESGAILPWTLSLSGLITTGQVSTKVGDVAVGKEYLLVILNSAPATTFVAGYLANLKLLGNIWTFSPGSGPVFDFGFSIAGLNDAHIYIQALLASAATFVEIDAGDGSMYGGGDNSILVVLLNGEIYTTHNNSGNNTNGIYLIYER